MPLVSLFIISYNLRTPDHFVIVGLLTVPVANMGDVHDVGRRQGMLFTILSMGAILGPPISGLINTSTGGYTAVGFYAGKL